MPHPAKRTNCERQHHLPRICDFGKPANHIFYSTDNQIVPITDAMAVPAWPRDTTPFPWCGVRVLQEIHALQGLKLNAGKQDIGDRAYFGWHKPNRYLLVQAMEHRDPFMRAEAYGLLMPHKGMRSWLDVGKRLANEPSARPERLALTQMFVQTMLGPHDNIKDARSLLRRRMLHLHPDRSDASLSAVALTHAWYFGGSMVRAQQGRNELVKLMMHVKDILNNDVYARCLYATDWESYGETRRRDYVFPFVALLFAFSLGFVTRQIGAAAGCLAGVRVAGGAIAVLCAIILRHNDKIF